MSTLRQTLSYQGFQATVEINTRRNVLLGEVQGTSKRLRFESPSVDGLVDAFHACVDRHIKDCTRAGKPVERGYSGTFQVRISAELHRRAAGAARGLGVPLTTGLMEAALTAYLEQHKVP